MILVKYLRHPPSDLGYQGLYFVPETLGYNLVTF